MTNTKPLEKNVEHKEVQKFDSIAMRWWDKSGEFKTLHDINPARVQYIERFCGNLKDKKILDVGCGGGILSEALAAKGAEVTGIDMGKTNLQVAKMHLYESNLQIDYQQITVEELAEQQPHQYDIVSCMEMLEHVPNPASVVQACCQLVKPQGDLFLSTITRKPKAYFLGVLMAEYVFNLLPRGTHEYQKFINPSELSAWLRQSNFNTNDLQGLHYNPLNAEIKLSLPIEINYLLHARQQSYEG